MTEIRGSHIHITGIVQGVGFRPFVYGLARELALTGWVRNTSAGVDIAVEGPAAALAIFIRSLQSGAPPLARIDSLEVSERQPNGYSDFQIIHSQPVSGAFQPISPDFTVCDDCRRELFDPANRRYRYPFINCTNCGPRFTIIKDIPYDRPLTTMASFAMCAACAAEYTNPLDRRFHAQPIACSDCGPHIWLEESPPLMPNEKAAPEVAQPLRGATALERTRELLRAGRIVAVKGLGGFHLACDALSEATVTELRRRKLRVDKAFAVMMPDLATVERHCYVDDAERQLLCSRARPIVILRRRPDCGVARSVAPGQDTVGVMLPYTPLHYLLLEPHERFPDALVMTSGNRSEEPIAYGNEEAHDRLSGLADAFLLHNRDIYQRCDDSVVRAAIWETNTGGERGTTEKGNAANYFLRRARGYAPDPVRLPFPAPPLLATGAELKNTFCLTRDRYAFLSHHIGNMENYETLTSFEEGVAHFERLFRIKPEAIAYDLHPDYLATRYGLARAESEGLPAVGVQHHHAHVAACMAEHNLDGQKPVIGVSFDGTGFGRDPDLDLPTIWGGEFLVADYASFERAAHLAYVPMPGGDRAIHEPWRLALAWLHAAGIPWESDLVPVRAASQTARGVVAHMLEVGVKNGSRLLNVPLTSSMGRLFDAVASLAGVRQAVNYEAQAAIELEALVDATEGGTYTFEVRGDIIDPLPVIAAIVNDLHAGAATPVIAARFHNGVAQMVLAVCRRLRTERDLNTVILSGGVWQNSYLLERTIPLLTADNFTVHRHRLVPANDGGLALGQAAIAANRLARGMI